MYHTFHCIKRNFNLYFFSEFTINHALTREYLKFNTMKINYDTLVEKIINNLSNN